MRGSCIKHHISSITYQASYKGENMSSNHENQGIQTRLIHLDRAENDSTGVSPPIFQTSTFLLHTPEQGADLAAQIAPATYYTRYGSPNTKQVEVLLADPEGGAAAPALGSGIAAVRPAVPV